MKEEKKGEEGKKDKSILEQIEIESEYGYKLERIYEPEPGRIRSTR